MKSTSFPSGVKFTPDTHSIEYPKATAEWSLNKNFDVCFRGPWKKPNLLNRTLQRWLLGIYWRDVK